jgi:hypothetical protein
MLAIGTGVFIHQSTAYDQPAGIPLAFKDLDGPMIVVVDQPDAKKPDKAKGDKPAGETKAVRFHMQGILDEIDVKENTIGFRDMIRHATMNLTKIKGQDGLGATFNLSKPTILKNVRVSGEAKITDAGKAKKLSDLKAGTPVGVDLEFRQGGLVVAGIQKIAGDKNNIRILGNLNNGNGIVIELEGLKLDLKKQKDKNP